MIKERTVKVRRRMPEIDKADVARVRQLCVLFGKTNAERQGIADAITKLAGDACDEWILKAAEREVTRTAAEVPDFVAMDLEYDIPPAVLSEAIDKSLALTRWALSVRELDESQHPALVERQASAEFPAEILKGSSASSQDLSDLVDAVRDLATRPLPAPIVEVKVDVDAAAIGKAVAAAVRPRQTGSFEVLSHDELGRPVLMRGSDGIVKRFAYDDDGRPVSATPVVHVDAEITRQRVAAAAAASRTADYRELAKQPGEVGESARRILKNGGRTAT